MLRLKVYRKSILCMWFHLNLCLNAFECIWICLNLSEYVWMHLNMSECICICLNAPEYVWMHLNMSEYVWMHLSMSEYVWMHLNMSECIGISFQAIFSPVWSCMLCPASTQTSSSWSALILNDRPVGSISDPEWSSGGVN